MWIQNKIKKESTYYRNSIKLKHIQSPKCKPIFLHELCDMGFEMSEHGGEREPPRPPTPAATPAPAANTYSRIQSMRAPSPPHRALLPLEAVRDSPAVPSDAAADLAAITGLVEEEEEHPDSRDEAEESDEVEMEGARPGEREPPPYTPPPTTRTPVSTPWPTVAPPPKMPWTSLQSPPRPICQRKSFTRSWWTRERSRRL